MPLKSQRQPVDYKSSADSEQQVMKDTTYELVWTLIRTTSSVELRSHILL